MVRFTTTKSSMRFFGVVEVLIRANKEFMEKILTRFCPRSGISIEKVLRFSTFVIKFCALTYIAQGFQIQTVH